ncbi:MAG: 50S ribosomal protein L35 [Candidatus Sungbacteria bacterium]|nr:50S ribosomal protein L35 [Candidatus Sungbacteria bacterium]
MLKTRKSITKRIKITSSGKLLRRVSRKNHFNAKERRATQLRGKGERAIYGVYEREIRAGLHN